MPNRPVRTTFRPDVEIEVGDAEYADLRAQGLLVEDTPTPKTPAPSPAAGSKSETKEGAK